MYRAFYRFMDACKPSSPVSMRTLQLRSRNPSLRTSLQLRADVARRPPTRIHGRLTGRRINANAATEKPTLAVAFALMRRRSTCPQLFKHVGRAENLYTISSVPVPRLSSPLDSSLPHIAAMTKSAPVGGSSRSSGSWRHRPRSHGPLGSIASTVKIEEVVLCSDEEE